VLLLAFSMMPVAFSFMGPKSGWALIGFFGVAIAFITTLVLINDASLTQAQGSTVQVLAAANGDFVSDFNAISVTPIALALTESYVVIRRAFNI
jgi:hypothetical protein